LFREKIPRSPIVNFFPDYTGGEDLQAACDYFSSRFVGLNQSSAKQIYCHVTCATDTTQIKFVLSAVNDIGELFILPLLSSPVIATLLCMLRNCGMFVVVEEMTDISLPK
jgi:hypothetical protein